MTRRPASGSRATPRGSRTRATGRSRGSTCRRRGCAGIRSGSARTRTPWPRENDNVWVANFGAAASRGSTRSSGRVVQTIPVGRGPVDIAVGQTSVWVSTQEGRVVRIDARSGRVVDPDIGVKAEGALDLGLGRLWIADRLDGTLRVYFITARAALRGAASLGDAPTDIAVGPRFAWAAVAGDGVIRRVPLASGGSGERVIETGGRPEALAVSKTGIWVADSERETLYRISRKTGRPLGRPIAVGEDPTGVAVGREAVWVTSAVTDSGAAGGATMSGGDARADPRAPAAAPPGRLARRGRGWPGYWRGARARVRGACRGAPARRRRAQRGAATAGARRRRRSPGAGPWASPSAWRTRPAPWPSARASCGSSTRAAARSGRSTRAATSWSARRSRSAVVPASGSAGRSLWISNFDANRSHA